MERLTHTLYAYSRDEVLWSVVGALPAPIILLSYIAKQLQHNRQESHGQKESYTIQMHVSQQHCMLQRQQYIRLHVAWGSSHHWVGIFSAFKSFSQFIVKIVTIPALQASALACPQWDSVILIENKLSKQREVTDD